ncbi:hypothetical protein [Flavobacterium sp. HNIBRBA15423]|uniref:hypothetical protein n=1 Tax=Flavobacterium sp. HNIBRBA15423 TaxID=3458683 RepID=UPI004043EF1F
MKKYTNIIFLNFFLLFNLTFFSCKENSNFSLKEKESETKIDSQIKTPIVLKDDSISIGKEIPFSIVEVFKENTNENAFVNSDTRLTIKTSSSFMLTKKDFIITDIDLSDTNYEGPGYIIYSYKSNEKKNVEIIIIEATADIGTDWYYVVVINNNDLVEQFLIKEPRANSEITDMKDFLSILLKNDTLIFKFRKSKIAKYSIMPSDLKNDNENIYLEKKLIF